MSQIRSSASLVAAGLVLAAGLWHPAMAEQTSEPIRLARQHRGVAVEVTATLVLPAGTGRVPAIVIHHGSGGVSEAREWHYARELVKLGVAALVIDSFTARGVRSTVRDQSTVTVLDMTGDAFAALARLAQHPRIDAERIGIVGFSKGGTVAVQTALARRAARALPEGPRFALHVAFYPGCSSHDYQPRTTGAPVIMLLGAEDTYVGVAPCTEYADKIRAAGSSVEVTIYPGAKHGFDGVRDYSNARGENWSGCLFEEHADGSWRERRSGEVTFANGRRVEEGRRAALAGCRTYGVTGGPDPAARAAAMSALTAAVRRHLADK